jgi:hypothetical protein
VEDAWRDPKVWRLFLRSLRQLKRIVEEAHRMRDDAEGDVKVIEMVFPYRHANNLCWLADDLRLLVRNGHIASQPVIARAMLESFFYLAACKTVPNFAARKSVWEMREFLRRASNFVPLTPEDALAAERAEIHRFIDRIERHYGLTANERPWTITQCINECGDVAFLRANYFFLSQHTHGSFLGLAARHDYRHIPLVQQAVLGSLITGGAFAAQVMPTATPQQHVDNATTLMGKLLQLMESGVLRRKRSPSHRQEDEPRR